jgi:hypothetical protein
MGKDLMGEDFPSGGFFCTLHLACGKVLSGWPAYGGLVIFCCQSFANFCNLLSLEELLQEQ